MILLLGVALKNRPMALLGATVVVLLNIGRLVAGAANLAVVPLRDGVNPGKMKKPVWRVVEPALTIGLVVLAFTFIPWLSSGKSAEGTIAERIRSGAQALKKDMKGEVGRVVDVEQLGAQAQQKLKELGDKAKEFDVEKLGAQAQAEAQGTRSLHRAARDRARRRPAGDASNVRPRSAVRELREPSVAARTRTARIAPADESILRDHPMSMSTTENVLPDDEVIELEPTQHVDLAGPVGGDVGLAALRPGAVAMAEGTLASLAGETDTLRRRRLLAAAVFLAATFGLLVVWVFASDNPGTLTAGRQPLSRSGWACWRCAACSRRPSRGCWPARCR